MLTDINYIYFLFLKRHKITVELLKTVCKRQNSTDMFYNIKITHKLSVRSRAVLIFNRVSGNKTWHGCSSRNESIDYVSCFHISKYDELKKIVLSRFLLWIIALA